MANIINIANYSNLAIVGSVEVYEAEINQRINDKYTLDFKIYKQNDTPLIGSEAIFVVDDDYFVVSEKVEYPIENRFDVSCEHVSYRLNVVEPLGPDEEEPEFTYTGQVFQIIEQILDGTRFNWIPSDDITGDFTFTTKTRGKRSQIIEFCKQNGFEVNWDKFTVAVQNRRGADNGLQVTLGENLREITVRDVYNVDGGITRSFDVDFLDLNELLDENGQPLSNIVFNMGDTIYVRLRSIIYAQRAVSVRYDPFKKALPTVDLENPNSDILEVIANNNSNNSRPSADNGNDGILETASAPFSNGLEFRFTKPYDNLYSVTVSTTLPQSEANVYYEEVKDAEDKFTGVKVYSIGSLSGVKVSMQAVVK